MIDAHTKKPLKILSSDDQGGRLQLPADQVDEIVKLFTDHGIRCWRDEIIWSSDGEPYRGSITISRNVKPAVAQALLDSIP